MERAIRLAWNYNQSCPWSVIEARRSRSTFNDQLPVRRSRGGGESASSLLVNDLDLLVDHLAGEAIDHHACLAEALAKAGVSSRAVHLRRCKA